MSLTQTTFLAYDHRNRPIVSIHRKISYTLLPDGRCRRADVQQPFLHMRDDGLEERLPPETDIIPYKSTTDLILIASAHAPSARGVTHMEASIELDRRRWSYRVWGERRCIYRGRGSIVFSSPARFDQMPLRYELAYGGCDPTVDPGQPKTMLEALTPHPGIYPRNPAGRGYVVQESAELIDGLLLPNVEHPEDLLTPERLVSGGPEHWWRQPLPWSCDWFDATWYPRSVFVGGVPDFLPDDDRKVPEVQLGYVEPFQNRRRKESPIHELFDGRVSDAASPSLILPFMRADEMIRLRGMTPGGELVVQLPGERPRMHVRFEGRLHEVMPVPHRILISTEEMGIYIVWHGGWPTPRPLPDRLPAEGDTAEKDMEGLEVYVDGRRVVPLS